MGCLKCCWFPFQIAISILSFLGFCRLVCFRRCFPCSLLTPFVCGLLLSSAGAGWRLCRFFPGCCQAVVILLASLRISQGFKCLVHQMEGFFATTFVWMNLQCSPFKGQLDLIQCCILIHQQCVIQGRLRHHDMADVKNSWSTFILSDTIVSWTTIFRLRLKI